MADYNWLTDDSDDEDEPRSTDALKEARKAAKASTRRVKELETELQSLRDQARERAVNDAIKEKGLDPKFARYASKLSDEEFNEFLADLSPETDGSGSQENPGQNGIEPVLFDANAAALSRISESHSSAPAPSGGPSDMAQKIAAAQSVEELNQLLFNNPSGPQVF